MFKDRSIGRGPLQAGLMVCALMLSCAGPAHAQWFGRDDGYEETYSYWRPFRYRPPVALDELRPREIIAALRERGFTRVSRPVYSEDVALVRAVDASGRAVFLTIDIYSGRIVDREFDRTEPSPPPRIVQRAPDQGPTIRRTVPETTAPARIAPEPAPEIRRAPVAPPQAAPPTPPRPERTTRPDRPIQPAKPPEASVGNGIGTGTGSGTRAQPRRIEIVPPAPLDAPPAPAPKRPEAPINSVPPAPLE